VSIDVCAAVAKGLGEAFECRPQGQYLRVRTPLLYPDGGVVDVFVRERDADIAVTDLGEALGWLRQQTVGGKRSPKQQRLLQDICLTLGVELFRGQLLARAANGAGLTDLILRVAQAAMRVGDLWFTTRTKSLESVADEVADYLQEQHMPYERAVKLAGRSGRDWTLDFQVHAPGRSALVFVLASGASEDDFRLVESISNISRWTRPDEFIELLRAA
jgi:hypothetical protein